MEVPSFDRKADQVTQVREYRLITPLFGGGVKPGELDPVTVVRGTAIRGHLRFWWRATQCGRFNDDLELMKRAEDDLWGAAVAAEDRTPRPSRVAVQVEVLDGGRTFVPDNRNRDISISHWRSPYSYAAFPLEQHQTVQEGVRFRLSVTFPAGNRDEMQAALWAWETFGGIGARTRRGFGALHCEKVDGTSVEAIQAEEIQDFIRQGLNRYVVDGRCHSHLPHLSHNGRFRATTAFDDSLSAWRYLLEALKAFRQKRYPGAQPRRPGRSRWPEPDAIRRLTGQQSSQHSRPLSNTDRFPRAAFGLPIVFQFKDKRQGDPNTTVLQGRQYDRMASPLIIRPLLCRDGRAIGLALILETPLEPPGGLMLNGAPGNPSVDQRLSPQDANDIEPLDGQTDVLQAFLDSI
jgi:CRISPR-associated protein Cmr1